MQQRGHHLIDIQTAGWCVFDCLASQLRLLFHICHTVISFLDASHQPFGMVEVASHRNKEGTTQDIFMFEPVRQTIKKIIE